MSTTRTPRKTLIGLALLFGAMTVGAQSTIGTQRRQATRAELEQAIAAAEAYAGQTDEKTRLRQETLIAGLKQRLRNGDFVPGDRLLLTVVGDSALTDTFTVKPDQKLSLPSIPDISLRGVLDSELATFLTQELSKYLKSPQVTATGLIRVQMSGGIGRPGFLTVPIDQLVTDVIMSAGGPGQAAQLEKAYVKRGSEKYLSDKQFSDALRTGRSVGDLSLRDGDEIVVPVQQATRWAGPWLGAIGALVPLVWILQGRGGRRNPVQ